MKDAVPDHLDAIAPEHRPQFDRLHVGVWQHGVSIYGWQEGRDAGFTARHP